MKKLIALVLALVCVLGLVGCGQPKQVPPEVDLDAPKNECWPGTITDIFTEGSGTDLAEVIKLEIKDHDPMHFTIVEDTEYLRYYSDTGETEEITKEDLYVGAWVEIDCESYHNSGYHPIFTIMVIEPNEPTKQLTLERVIELSAKGEKLTWSDFEQYAYEDIGSGLYIYRYDIDNNYELRITGSPSVEPMHIRLISKANQDNYIDIRTESVSDFIKSME